jgi:hypothetical protein
MKNSRKLRWQILKIHHNGRRKEENEEDKEKTHLGRAFRTRQRMGWLRGKFIVLMPTIVGILSAMCW